MALKIVGLLAFVAVTSAQSGIGYYGHHLQNQHHKVEVHHEPEIHLQEQVHYAVPEVHHQAKIHLQPQVQVYHQPQVHYQPQHHEEEEHHGPAHYKFNYDIHDDHTGDVHGRQEVREGDKTEGQYYLIDADGHKRTVTYQVHGKSGFIAQVHRELIKGYQAPLQHQSHHDYHY